MAQMQPVSNRGKSRRTSLFVDLTPMVDLAFLLISFFMLTTVMAKNTAMQLSMPEKSDKPGEQKASSTLNIIVTDKGAWYYMGMDPLAMEFTDLSASGIREAIYQSQEKSLTATGDSLMCLIKLHAGSNYGNMVNLLDEMVITNTRYYAIQDILPAEEAVLQAKPEAK